MLLLKMTDWRLAEIKNAHNKQMEELKVLVDKMEAQLLATQKAEDIIKSQAELQQLRQGKDSLYEQVQLLNRERTMKDETIIQLKRTVADYQYKERQANKI
jgi:ribosomal protein S8